jgi:FHS family L-fucose permease-like MFS transporter
MPVLGESLAKSLPAEMTALRDGAWHVTDRGAAILLSFGGFVLFLAGRFIGSLLLRTCRAHKTLAWFSLVNVVMMVLIVAPLAWVSVAALFLSFFFMSIMYPTIFALGIRGLGAHTKLASSLIVMSIVGGAVMPLIMGRLADLFSMRVGFVMPLGCFVAILAYAIFWPQLEQQDAGHPPQL